MSAPSWYVGDAPPGWVSTSPAAPLTQSYSQSWSATSSASSAAVHGIGPTEYSLPVAPFNGDLGDLYTATVRIYARFDFTGTLGSTGGGAGGAFAGYTWMGYGASDVGASTSDAAFFSYGGGGGDGGGPNDVLTWFYEVDGEFAFSAQSAAEAASRACSSTRRPPADRAG